MYLIFILLWACQPPGIAQKPFADGKTIHTRSILDGKATILLPDDFSYGRPITIIDNKEIPHATSYSDRNMYRNIYCSINKNKLSQETLYEHYMNIKSMYSDKYLVVLKDEFVADGDNSYFYYECRLKDELYRKAGEPTYEINDTAFTGVIVPNYFCFYHFLKDGQAINMAADYQGDIDGLEDFRGLWQQIKNSFTLVN